MRRATATARHRPPSCVQYEDHGIGASGDPFTGLFDDIQRVQILGIKAVRFQDAGGIVALQRGEAKMSAAIALEDKLHQAVTEAANAVVEKDRIGGIWHARARGQRYVTYRVHDFVR